MPNTALEISTRLMKAQRALDQSITVGDKAFSFSTDKLIESLLKSAEATAQTALLLLDEIERQNLTTDPSLLKIIERAMELFGGDATTDPDIRRARNTHHDTHRGEDSNTSPHLAPGETATPGASETSLSPPTGDCCESGARQFLDSVVQCDDQSCRSDRRNDGSFLPRDHSESSGRGFSGPRVASASAPVQDDAAPEAGPTHAAPLLHTGHAPTPAMARAHALAHNQRLKERGVV